MLDLKDGGIARPAASQRCPQTFDTRNRMSVKRMNDIPIAKSYVFGPMVGCGRGDYHPGIDAWGLRKQFGNFRSEINTHEFPSSASVLRPRFAR